MRIGRAAKPNRLLTLSHLPVNRTPSVRNSMLAMGAWSFSFTNLQSQDSTHAWSSRDFDGIADLAEVGSTGNPAGCGNGRPIAATSSFHTLRCC